MTSALHVAPNLVGDARRLPEGLPATIAACIGSRVAEMPGGILRSIDAATYRQTTFVELWDRAGRIAAGIASQVAPERPVVCIQSDFLDALTAFWACLRSGRTAIPFTSVAQTMVRADSAADPLGALLDPVLLVDAPTAAAAHLCRMRPDMRVLRLDAVETLGIGASYLSEVTDTGSRPACLIPTSGSTGHVKLVALSDSALRHRNFSANYRSRNSNQHCLGLFPFDSITGLRSAFLNAGAWTQLAGRIVAGDPLQILRCLADQQINSVQTTNALAARMVDAADRSGFRGDLSSLVTFGLGGEAVTRPVARRLAALLQQCGADCAIQAGYGATETSPIVSGADPTVGSDEDGPVPLGGCAAGMSLRIVGDDGETLPEGVVGDIEVSCPQLLFSGYADGSHLSSFTADGWWRTGDLGETRDGNLLFRGRRKEVIVVDGVKLSLIDIDLFLQNTLGCPAHAAILRAATDATDRLGIGLFRLGAEAPTEKAIRDLIARRFSLSVAVVASLEGDPTLTATGKIDRIRLAARLSTHRRSTPVSSSQGRTITEKVAAAWRTALGFETVPTIDFFTAGGDSFSVVRLQLAWEEEFGTPLAAEAFRGAATQAAMAALAVGTQGTSAAVLDQFQRRQQQLLANWEGTRPTRSGLVVGRSVATKATPSLWQRLRGLRPRRTAPADSPMFWLLQHGNELSLLQKATPLDIPVFGLGSGKNILDLKDSQALAEVVARYMLEIREIQPNGPYRIGGACRGAELALALARALEAAGETVALLTLVDANVRNLFQAPYGGKVALIIGHKSPASPLHLYADPAREMETWASKGFLFRLIDADYAEVFLPERLAELRVAIAEAMAWARIGE